MGLFPLAALQAQASLAVLLKTSIMAEQNERAFQKQRMIRGVHGKVFSKKTPGKNGARWYKNVGLGFKTPKEAIEGTYIDKKCPSPAMLPFAAAFSPVL